MKRIACKRSLSLRQHFARGPKVKGGEGQLELPGIPAPTLADHARAVEVKLADSIARALNRGWKATKRTIREIVKPEPKPVQLDITLRDATAKGLTPQEAAAAWLRDHAAELKDFDCDKLDRKPLCGRTHDGEGAHPVEAVDGLEYVGDHADPLTLLVEAETLAETGFDAYVDPAAERARLEDDRKQRTPETTLRRLVKKAAARMASGQQGFLGAGFAL